MKHWFSNLYDGPLVSGIDLISFEVGDKVTVKQPM
jgi:hypothetical protein